MKILYPIIILALLFSFALADQQEAKYTESVSVFLTVDGGSPQNYAAGSNTPAPNSDHPDTMGCTWHINGLTFWTWFIDSSAGYISTDTFFPGDEGEGHSVMDLGTLVWYTFNMANFANIGRSSNVELYDGDTLHMRFRYVDAAGTEYYGCFDTVYHVAPGVPGTDAINIALVESPDAACRNTNMCFPTGGVADKQKTPKEYYLAQNSPNPFNSSTEIEYYIPENADVSIDVYDLRGTKIKALVSEFQTEGSYSVKWNGTDQKGNSVPTGSYFYKIQAGEYETQKRMLFIK